MVHDSGLREQKKQQTRAALLQSAYELFQRKGYSNTSIEDIAKQANYAPRTFFLHFKSKEELLFPDAQRIKSSLEYVMQARKDGEPTLMVLKRWIMQLADKKQNQNAVIQQLQRKIINQHINLQSRQKVYLSVIEDVIAREVSKDTGLSPDNAGAKLIAAATVAIFAKIDDLAGHELSTAQARSMVNQAIAIVEAGIGALEKVS